MCLTRRAANAPPTITSNTKQKPGHQDGTYSRPHSIPCTAATRILAVGNHCLGVMRESPLRHAQLPYTDLPMFSPNKRFSELGSATIVFIIERLFAQNAARPCVALAFGPGLVVEAALFQ